MTFDPLDEGSVRAAVHDAFSRFTPPTETSSFQNEVRAGAGRLRAIRWASGAVGGVAILATTLLAVGTFGHDRSQQSAAVVATPPQCPSLPDRPPASPARAGADKKLVPGHPVIGTYCDFVSVPGADMRSVTTLRKSGTLSGAQLKSVLDAVRRPFEPGMPGCAPSLRGEHLLLLFRYTSGPDVMVSMDLRGCPGVNNGSLVGMFAPAAQLPLALSALGVDPGVTEVPSSQR